MGSTETEPQLSNVLDILDANITHYLEPSISRQSSFVMQYAPAYHMYEQKLNTILGSLGADIRRDFLKQASRRVATQMDRESDGGVYDIFGLGSIGRTILKNSEELDCLDSIDPSIEQYYNNRYKPEAKKFFGGIRTSINLAEGLSNALGGDDEFTWTDGLREIFVGKVEGPFSISPYIDMAIDIEEWDVLAKLLEYQAVSSTYVSSSTSRAVDLLVEHGHDAAIQQLSKLEDFIDQSEDRIKKFGTSVLAFEYARALGDKEHTKHSYLRMIEVSSIFGISQTQNVGKIEDIVDLYEQDGMVKDFITEFIGKEYDPDDPTTTELSDIDFRNIINRNLHVPLAVFLADNPIILNPLKSSERGREVLNQILEICLNIREDQYAADFTGSFTKNVHTIAKLYLDLNPDIGQEKLRKIIDEKREKLDTFYDRVEAEDQSMVLPPDFMELLGLSALVDDSLCHDSLVRIFSEIVPRGNLLVDSRDLDIILNTVDSIPDENLSASWLSRLLARVRASIEENIIEGNIINTNFGALFAQLKLYTRYAERLEDNKIDKNIKEILERLTDKIEKPLTITRFDFEDTQDYRIHLMLIKYLISRGGSSFDNNTIMRLVKNLSERKDFEASNELALMLIK